MFQLSKSTEYAILFLTKLTGFSKAKPLKLQAASKENHLPYKFLSRIVLNLKKAKIILSKEGVKGGYFLNKPENKINLKQIIQAVEGKKGLVTCIYGNCVLRSKCHHQSIWLRVQRKLNKELEKISLSDLAK